LIAGIRIDAEGCGEVSLRDRIADLPGDRDRPDPGQRIGKIAKPFAEIDGRRVGIERICADARRAATF
jgi:hypothetical protein